jgi:serine/threonine protein kinase/tetratricopeptide (TPR) repeat protein
MAAPSQLVGRTLGHYRILEKIGAGGMGVVYRARDTRLDRDVAIKVLTPGLLADENARKRFRKEALTLSRLSHPNIETIFDFDSQEDIDFLVTEYIHGETLDSILASGPLPEVRAIHLGTQLAEGIEEAHQQEVVHCDLKPGNLRVGQNGHLKILDFGLAKYLGPVTGTTTTASLSEVHFGGTLPYMAPELLRGEQPDFRSDIYAAGSVLYEMSTGQRMFPETDRARLANAILHETPRPPSEVNTRISFGFENIVLKATDKEPERRYQSAREFLIDLSRLSESSPSTRAARLKRRFPRRSVVLGTVVLMILGALSIRQWRRSVLPQHQLVLVADFENRTGELIFDQTLRELLTTTLEQSHYLTVFPLSRVPDVLQRMERSGTARLDEATGREICMREGLQALLTGSISRIGKNYVLVARAVSPSGRNLASIQQIVPEADQVPAAMDVIAEKLRTGLGESGSSVTETSIPLEEVTSRSLEAVRYFSLGKQRLYTGDAQEARSLFVRALELDQAFAMAHEYLGITYVHLNDPIQATKQLLRATQLVEHVTETEKHKILGDYDLQVRNFDEAIAHFQLLTQLQPQDPAAYLNLGDCYAGKLQFDSAVEQTEKGIKLQSLSGPRENLAEILFLKGDTARVLSIAQEILHDNPKDSRALNYLGKAYLLNGQFDEARRVFDRMVQAGGDQESEGRAALADMALASGHYREAQSHLEAGIITDEKSGSMYSAASKWILLATLDGRQEPTRLLARAIPKDGETDPRLVLLLGMTLARRRQLADAQNMLRTMEHLAQQNPVPTVIAFEYVLRAELALARAAPAAAVEAAQTAVHYENSTFAVETLARSYAEAGSYGDAIREYEQLLARRNERSHSYDTPAFHKVVEAHYRLGVLYQEVAQLERARNHLQIFLSYSSQPDAHLEIYRDAARRLRVLASRESPTPAT